MIHARSLVHDDLSAMDNDLERRGRPNVHVAFGHQLVSECDGLAEQFGARAEPLRALSKWVKDRAHAANAGVKAD